MRLSTRLVVVAAVLLALYAGGRLLIAAYPPHVCRPGEVPVRVVSGGVLSGGACQRAGTPVRPGELTYPPGHVPDLLRDEDAADAALEREVAAVRARLCAVTDVQLAAAVQRARTAGRPPGR